MARISGSGRRILGACTAFAFGLSALVLSTGTATAEVKEKTGLRVEPGQTYSGKPHNYDWLGTYEVGGKQAFCVQFEYKAPNSNEKYQPGDELKTKWGEALSADTAADISYLLLRYGKSPSTNEAAAVAHLLHSWTSPAREGKDDLNPKNDFKHIAYDTNYHLEKLPAEAKNLVSALKKEAETNRGPWTVSITPPDGDQTIGTAAEWTVTVKSSKGKGISEVPVTLNLTDGTFDQAGSPTSSASPTTTSSGTSSGTSSATPSGTSSSSTSSSSTTTSSKSTSSSGTSGSTTSTSGSGDSGEKAKKLEVTTNKDGVAKVKVTPTGDNPKLVSNLLAPADKPYVQSPVTADTQKIVSTGGEKEITAEASAKAQTKPGIVQVSKVDSKTGKGIAGAQLKITGKDKSTPATGQDGKPLVEGDKPKVVVTEGENGTASITNLKTPQEICVVEVAAPPGYDESYDANNPPSACGEINAGETLTLQVKNTPNQVPMTIPAGAATGTVEGAVSSIPSAGGLIGLGGLALLGSALVGVIARRQLGAR